MPSRYDTIIPLIHVAVPAYLRDTLRADEHVLAALRGTAQPRRRGASGTTVTLVLSSERVVYGSSSLFRHSVHELAYKRISTVSYQRGLLSSSLTLHARELTLTVRLRNKSEWSTIDRIVSAVKAGIVFSPLAQASGPAGPPASSTRSQGDGLEALDPLAFEELIRQLLEAMGYQARLTQRSHDGGIDVHAFDPQPIRGGAVVVQCKLYKNAVPVECVRDLYGVVHSEGATKGILITTSHFSADGHAFAKNKPLELIERRSLEALLQQYGLMDQERSGAWGWPGQGGL